MGMSALIGAVLLALLPSVVDATRSNLFLRKDRGQITGVAGSANHATLQLVLKPGRMRGEQMLYATQSFANAGDFRLAFYGSRLRLTVVGNSCLQQCGNTQDTLDSVVFAYTFRGNFYNIMVVYDVSAKTCTLFLDGAEEEVITLTTIVPLLLADATVGVAREGNRDVFPFQGTLKECAIWRRISTGFRLPSARAQFTGLTGTEADLTVLYRDRTMKCTSWGDPHITNFYSHRFDFQQPGAYDFFGMVDWKIQVSHRDCGRSRRVKCNKIVWITSPDGERLMLTWENLDNWVDSTNTGVVLPHAFASGPSLVKKGSGRGGNYELVVPNQFTFDVQAHRSHMNVRVVVSGGGQVDGLCSGRIKGRDEVVTYTRTKAIIEDVCWSWASTDLDDSYESEAARLAKIPKHWLTGFLHLGTTYRDRIVGGSFSIDYLGGEDKLTPYAGQTHRISGGTENELTWTPLTRDDGCWACEREGTPFVQYFAAALWSEKEQDVTAIILHQDDVVCYVDGGVAFQRTGWDQGRERQMSPFKMKQGWSQMLCKLYSSGKACRFQVRFAETVRWAYELPTRGLAGREQDTVMCHSNQDGDAVTELGQNHQFTTLLHLGEYCDHVSGVPRSDDSQVLQPWLGDIEAKGLYRPVDGTRVVLLKSSTGAPLQWQEVTAMRYGQETLEKFAYGCGYTGAMVHYFGFTAYTPVSKSFTFSVTHCDAVAIYINGVLVWWRPAWTTLEAVDTPALPFIGGQWSQVVIKLYFRGLEEASSQFSLQVKDAGLRVLNSFQKCNVIPSGETPTPEAVCSDAQLPLAESCCAGFLSEVELYNSCCVDQCLLEDEAHDDDTCVPADDVVEDQVVAQDDCDGNFAGSTCERCKVGWYDSADGVPCSQYCVVGTNCVLGACSAHGECIDDVCAVNPCYNGGTCTPNQAALAELRARGNVVGKDRSHCSAVEQAEVCDVILMIDSRLSAAWSHVVPYAKRVVAGLGPSLVATQQRLGIITYGGNDAAQWFLSLTGDAQAAFDKLEELTSCSGQSCRMDLEDGLDLVRQAHTTATLVTGRCVSVRVLSSGLLADPSSGVLAVATALHAIPKMTVDVVVVDTTPVPADLTSVASAPKQLSQVAADTLLEEAEKAIQCALGQVTAVPTTPFVPYTCSCTDGWRGIVCSQPQGLPPRSIHYSGDTLDG